MELTKQAIAEIRLTCVQNKYYIAREVDSLLDEISESADRLHQEKAEVNRIGELEREELTRLRRFERSAREEIQKLSERVELLSRANADAPKALFSADEQARDIMRQAAMEKDAILRDVKRKHARAVAANRCAYYSALQFKQDMQHQFEEFASQMNLAMSALMAVDDAQPCITVGESGESSGSDRREDESIGYAEKGNPFYEVNRNNS